jgi:AcrR family transcriptional regulator
VAEIADTALDLIDEVGLDGLTMRRLADTIGVTPMTLYRYLPNKEAILAVVADLLWQQLPRATPPSPSGWQTQLATMWRHLFNLMQRHPNAVPLIARGGTYSNTAAADTAGMLGVLKDAGFTPALANEFLHIASALVVGFAFAQLWQQQAGHGNGPAHPAGDIQPIPPDMLDFAQAMGPFAPEEFDSALRLVIADFATRL